MKFSILNLFLIITLVDLVLADWYTPEKNSFRLRDSELQVAQQKWNIKSSKAIPLARFGGMNSCGTLGNFPLLEQHETKREESFSQLCLQAQNSYPAEIAPADPSCCASQFTMLFQPNSCWNPEIRDATSIPSVPQPFRILFHVPTQSDGTNPLVTETQIKLTMDKVKIDFAPTGFVPTYQIHWVPDDSLRFAPLQNSPAPYGDPGCYAEILGGTCDDACNNPFFGYDLGACKIDLNCNSTKVGDKSCDPECNLAAFSWDGGDCCNPRAAGAKHSCVDPNSPLRIWRYSIDDFKRQMVSKYDPSVALSIFVCRDISGSAVALGVLPSSNTLPGKDLSETGGVVTPASLFGDSDVSVGISHEIGHTLGLLHTFQFAEKCQYCHEWNISSFDSSYSWPFPVSYEDLTGDFNSDTPPIPLVSSWMCLSSDEQLLECDASTCSEIPNFCEPCIEDSCMPYSTEDYYSFAAGNIMSYSWGCSRSRPHFTPLQNLRMSCFLQTRLASFLGTWDSVTSQTLKWTEPAPLQRFRTASLKQQSDIPNSWFCNPENYAASDGCHCGCGAFDPDCSSSNIIRNCPLGKSPSCSPEGECIYEQPIPPSWICPSGYYASSDGCDCGCGIIDPDCFDPMQMVFGCEDGVSCDAAGLCQIVVPDSWNCDPSYYGTLDGCDCNCGAADPDCLSFYQQFWLFGCNTTARDELCYSEGICLASPMSCDVSQGQCLPSTSSKQFTFQRATPNISPCSSMSAPVACIQEQENGLVFDGCGDPDYPLPAFGRRIDAHRFIIETPTFPSIVSCLATYDFPSFEMECYVPAELFATQNDTICTFEYRSKSSSTKVMASTLISLFCFAYWLYFANKFI